MGGAEGLNGAGSDSELGAAEQRVRRVQAAAAPIFVDDGDGDGVVRRSRRGVAWGSRREALSGQRWGGGGMRSSRSTYCCSSGRGKAAGRSAGARRSGRRHGVGGGTVPWSKSLAAPAGQEVGRGIKI
ncbi:hypothetical protein BRADI_4g10343v3 [Brachypodium distachyon]|uniref:DUF834 domain-containing protein n=1 Tax=Brachypodium distachyon TaxID=15368 RepID=I1IJG7_BRADI|nr:hypothetical protein BRADI_4g10343v3 [Brachypodium distachyon]